MIEKMAVNVVTQMTEEKIIIEKYKDYYVYSLILLLEGFITVGTIILLSMLFKNFIQTILFLVFFLSLRKRTGGYHLKKFYQCYLCTVFSYLFILSFSNTLAKYPTILMLMLFLSIGFIEIIGTVNHPNIHMNTYELMESKRSARILVLIEGSIIFCFLLLGVDMLYISYQVIALVLCATLLCLAKITKQEV